MRRIIIIQLERALMSYMFCDFKVNGVSSFDNRRQTFVDKGIVSTNTNVQILAKMV